MKIMVKTAFIYPLLGWWRHRDIRRMEAVNRVKNEVRSFEEFRNKHIDQSRRIYGTLTELRQDPPAADVYIAGSDQIWNPMLLRRKDGRAFWLDFGEDRVMEYDGSQLDLLDLAYATTIHKSQGSEYDSVIISVQCAHSVMLNRPLLYTAVTRAKKRVILVGERKALCAAIRRTDTEHRNTQLARRILDQLEQLREE